MLDGVSAFTPITLTSVFFVTMATLLFCCWRKKDSEDISGSKDSSPVPGSGERQKEKSPAPPVNGLIPADQRVTNEAQRPLLEPSARTDSQDDLGDFSMVLRETEILRSYRRAAPPKNRARQTRAPPHLRGSAESLDIFTELSDQDSRLDTSDVKEDNPAEEADHVFHNVGFQEGDKVKGEQNPEELTLLADIDKTLAAQPRLTPPSAHRLPVINFSTPAESIPKICIEVDAEDKPPVDDKKQTTPKNSPAVKKKTCLSDQHLHSQQSSIQNTLTSQSAHSSQNVRPKTGPKVSPKPVHRVISASVGPVADVKTARVSALADAILNKQTEVETGSSASVNFSTANPSHADLSTEVRSLVSQSNPETSDLGTIAETVSDLRTIRRSTGESSTTNIQAHTQVDNTGSDVPSLPSDFSAALPNDFQSEVSGYTEGSDTIKASECKRLREASVNDTDKIQLALAESGQSVTEGSVPSSEFVDSNSETLVLPSKDTLEVTSNKDTLEVTSNKDTLEVTNKKDSDAIDIKTGESAVTEPAAASLDKLTTNDELDTKDQATPLQPGNGHNGQIKHDGKQTKDVMEDQVGKGKISKIPVRSSSGSKMRSSPP